MNLPDSFTEDKEHIHAVVETPMFSRQKISYNTGHGYFELNRVLADAYYFPFNFGFIPHTLAGDGDPLDVLVVHEHPLSTGTVAVCSCIGIIEVEQKEKSKGKYRNDRLIAIPLASKFHKVYTHIKQVEKQEMNAWLEFLEIQSRHAGKSFKLLGLRGPSAAFKSVHQHCIPAITK